MDTPESLLETEPLSDATLSPEERAVLQTLTIEEIEALLHHHQALGRPDQRGIPTFHVSI